MFKYLWIVLLGIVYLFWTISAVKDIWYELNNHYKWYQFSFENLEDSTIGWIIATIATPTILSLLIYTS